MENLSIFLGKRLVGTLSRYTRGRVQFKYARQWLKTVGRPISLSLPCREEKFPPALSTAFFENLLPESGVRSILAFNNRFDKKDTLAFLNRYGWDCAGALSIMAQGKEPDLTPWCYEHVTQKLAQALDRLETSSDQRQLYLEMQPAHLSIAGVQDKLPVYFKENKFYLPTNSGSATTHIIKPMNPMFPGIQRNEAFCMDLARIIGIRVPNSKLIQMGPHELYLVERYDRKILPERVARIHQEDFCQAMGLPVDRKYQIKGGPGFRQCRSLIDEYLSPSAQIRAEMAFILVFNALIGNHDAHGKNFSIIHGSEFTMAPYYDLLSTQVYDTLEKHFSMSIGKTFRQDRLHVNAFKAFAADMKFRPAKLAEIMAKAIRPVELIYKTVLGKHKKEYGPAKIYTDLSRVISGNIEQLKAIQKALV